MKKFTIILLAGVLLAGCASKVNGPCDIYEKYGAECVAAQQQRIIYANQ